MCRQGPVFWDHLRPRLWKGYIQGIEFTAENKNGIASIQSHAQIEATPFIRRPAVATGGALANKNWAPGTSCEFGGVAGAWAATLFIRSTSAAIVARLLKHDTELRTEQ